MFCNVNVWAWLVASIVTFGIGALWYAPVGFGKIWMALSKIDPMKMQSESKKCMATRYGIHFVTTLVTTFILARAIFMIGSATWLQGAFLGFWIWVGFVGSLSIVPVLWEGRSKKLVLINAGYYLVAFVVASMILAAWR